MIRTIPIALLGMVLLVHCCPALSHGQRSKKGGDIERLQGTWLADLEPGRQDRLVLDGSRLLLVHIHGDRETTIWNGHFAINEKATPKEMDWTPLRNDRGANAPSNLAIYQLEGDLLLVIGSTKSPRPTAFYSGGGRDLPKTVIYRRQKKASPRRRGSAGNAPAAAGGSD